MEHFFFVVVLTLKRIEDKQNMGQAKREKKKKWRWINKRTRPEREKKLLNDALSNEICSILQIQCTAIFILETQCSRWRWVFLSNFFSSIFVCPNSFETFQSILLMKSEQTMHTFSQHSTATNSRMCAFKIFAYTF